MDERMHLTKVVQKICTNRDQLVLCKTTLRTEIKTIILELFRDEPTIISSCSEFLNIMNALPTKQIFET